MSVCLSVCPDILMYNELLVSTELDVSMAHPWGKDIINRASEEAGYAAERLEMRKKSKYRLCQFRMA